MNKIFIALMATVLLPSAHGGNPGSDQRIRELVVEQINSKLPALIRSNPNLKGEKGDTGAKGPQGETGAQGSQGSAGSTDPQGEMGMI